MSGPYLVLVYFGTTTGLSIRCNTRTAAEEVCGFYRGRTTKALIVEDTAEETPIEPPIEPPSGDTEAPSKPANLVGKEIKSL